MQVDTRESVIEQMIKNWLAWQNTAKGYRLSLTTPSESEFMQVDVGEAAKTEKVMLRLKLINSDAVKAIVIYYRETKRKSMFSLASKADMGETKFRQCLESGRHFLYGSII